MTAEAPTPDTDDPRAAIWRDDMLDRRGFADFLTNALTEHTRVVSERQRRGLTVALDAGWGTGKSFFVTRWADDLTQRGHPVVVFDAWENDLGDEAAIALMAAIKQTVDGWVARMPAKQALKARAGALVREGVKELRKAVLPASKVVAAGMLKKYTGIAIREVMDAVDGDDPPPGELEDEFSNERIEAGLDAIFESALGEQQKRNEAIKNFKASIAKALALINKNTEATLPAFVFVDELDRCRPPYAIKLLEEIKHIFGIPNVCFVVSTHLTQIHESVRAVYGPSFDGYGYLKRFFDASYRMPPPRSNSRYVEVLLKESSLFAMPGPKLIGFPLVETEECEGKNSDAIALMFALFDLDLRSQKQVLSIADAAAASLKDDERIHLVWLFFAAIVVFKFPREFEQLKSKPYEESEFDSMFLGKINLLQSIQYQFSTETTSLKDGILKKRNTIFQKKVPLIEILRSYCKFSTFMPNDFVKEYESMENMEDDEKYNEYEDVKKDIMHAIIDGEPSEHQIFLRTPFSNMYEKNPISCYFELIEYAGYRHDIGHA